MRQRADQRPRPRERIIALLRGLPRLAPPLRRYVWLHGQKAHVCAATANQLVDAGLLKQRNVIGGVQRYYPTPALELAWEIG